MFRESESLGFRESENYPTRLGRGENKEGREGRGSERGGGGANHIITSEARGKREEEGEKAHHHVEERQDKDRKSDGRVSEK